MALGETFNLGQLIATAESIKGQRESNLDAKFRREYAGQQAQYAANADARAAAAEGRAATQFSQEQQIQNTKLLNAAATEVAANPQAVTRWLPQLQQAGILQPGVDISAIPPEQLQQAALQLRDSTAQALAALTPEVGARRDAELAVVAARGEQDRQTLAERSKAEAAAAQTAYQRELQLLKVRGQQAIDAARATNNAKATETARSNDAALQKTWRMYTSARKGLLSGLGETVTGPIVGRAPALTEEQQTAEGGVSAMAPVLKQIFRVAGEGTFTDKDQELLLGMVPTRKDLPAARKKKIENIDSIIKAKLGLADSASVEPTAGASGSWSVEVVR